MSITIAKWTIDQYHELVVTGILDDRRVELLAGVLSRCHQKECPMPFTAVKR
jgi:hypothetical protein